MKATKAILTCWLITLTASYALASEYKVSTERVVDILNIAYENIHELRNKKYGVIVTNSNKLNAWSAGSIITVTSALLKKLDDKALMAVLLHETAHSTKSHIAHRMANLAGVNVLFSLERLKNLISGAKNNKSYRQQLSEFAEQYSTQQEMQADCIAYNWLLELKSEGLNFDPLDLNTATQLIIGLDFTDFPHQYGKDLPPYLRFKRVQHGHPKQCH